MCYTVDYYSWRRGESLIARQLLKGGFGNEKEGTILHHALIFWVFGGPWEVSVKNDHRNLTSVSQMKLPHGWVWFPGLAVADWSSRAQVPPSKGQILTTLGCAWAACCHTFPGRGCCGHNTPRPTARLGCGGGGVARAAAEIDQITCPAHERCLWLAWRCLDRYVSHPPPKGTAPPRWGPLWLRL